MGRPDKWELIETLWNVNICKGLGIHLQDIRINRNIVECKSKDKGQFINQFIELIETLWNVNPFDCI